MVPSVDIYARLYASNGAPKGNEFIVNTDSNPCANPAVAAASDGGFMVAWDARDMAETRPTAWTFTRGHFPVRALAARPCG